MKTLPRIARIGTVLSCLTALLGCRSAPSISNSQIARSGFEKVVRDTGELHESRRLTEEQFLAMMTQPDCIVLDARSESHYRLRHIRGAVNLPFTEFTVDTLKRVIPTKSTKILIYCNNNFLGAPFSFPEKAIAAALNLSTYVSLQTYHYDNVFELGPLLDVTKTKIPFEGQEVTAVPAR